MLDYDEAIKELKRICEVREEYAICYGSCENCELLFAIQNLKNTQKKEELLKKEVRKQVCKEIKKELEEEYYTFCDNDRYTSTGECGWYCSDVLEVIEKVKNGTN